MKKFLTVFAFLAFYFLPFGFEFRVLAANEAPSANSGTNEGLNLGSYLYLGKDNVESVADVYSTPAILINTIVRNLFVIAGIIFLFLIVFSGFKMIYQGKKGAEEARSILTAAVGGLFIMFAAYWIVQIVEVVTGVKILL